MFGAMLLADDMRCRLRAATERYAYVIPRGDAPLALSHAIAITLFCRRVASFDMPCYVSRIDIVAIISREAASTITLRFLFYKLITPFYADVARLFLP